MQALSPSRRPHRRNILGTGWDAASGAAGCGTGDVVESFTIEQDETHAFAYFGGDVWVEVGDIGTATCEIVGTCGDVGLRAEDVEVSSSEGVLSEARDIGEANSITFEYEGLRYNLRCPHMRRSTFSADEMDCDLREL